MKDCQKEKKQLSFIKSYSFGVAIVGKHSLSRLKKNKKLSLCSASCMIWRIDKKRNLQLSFIRSYRFGVAIVRDIASRAYQKTWNPQIITLLYRPRDCSNLDCAKLGVYAVSPNLYLNRAIEQQQKRIQWALLYHTCVCRKHLLARVLLKEPRPNGRYFIIDAAVRSAGIAIIGKHSLSRLKRKKENKLSSCSVSCMLWRVAKNTHTHN